LRVLYSSVPRHRGMRRTESGHENSRIAKNARAACRLVMELSGSNAKHRSTKQQRQARSSPTNPQPTSSPPRVRGKDRKQVDGHRHVRFTPACAGKGLSQPQQRAALSVHPRMRGERNLKLDVSLPVTGSPPHARGKGLSRTLGPLGGRFTPACAGKGLKNAFSNKCNPVHPRMRGERHTNRLGNVARLGSPPHARGKDYRALLDGKPSRFTPACAGKGRVTLLAFIPTSVHPRMRGERTPTPYPLGDITGSPPHARGKGTVDSAVSKFVRFTPACAGIMPVGRARQFQRPGSPPHARGKVARTNASRGASRFTPARAGKGYSASPHPSTLTVHPRTRGERAV
jgi:hypothetical protein